MSSWRCYSTCVTPEQFGLLIVHIRVNLAFLGAQSLIRCVQSAAHSLFIVPVLATAGYCIRPLPRALGASSGETKSSLTVVPYASTGNAHRKGHARRYDRCTQRHATDAVGVQSAPDV